MWPSNELTERLGLAWPIIQAPMAGATTPELAAAVSNAWRVRLSRPGDRTRSRGGRGRR